VSDVVRGRAWVFDQAHKALARVWASVLAGVRGMVWEMVSVEGLGGQSEKGLAMGWA